MSKYDILWQKIKEIFDSQNLNVLTLTFAEVEKLGNVKIDHSLLSCKKDLLLFGVEIKKISLKNKEITFKKIYPKNFKHPKIQGF